MSETLPLFPLGTVLFPGLLLPLHIFEDRYRKLVRDLLSEPGEQRFGVIAIREGRETGVDGVRDLYDIGCTAGVRRATEHDDGTYDLVTVGVQRFRLISLDRSAAYLRGEVEMLGDGTGDDAAARVAAQPVRAAFRAYLELLAARGVKRIDVPELPGDPVVLSYLVAASVIADLPERQALLAEADVARRLAAERALLARETGMLRTLTAAPAPQMRYSPYSAN